MSSKLNSSWARSMLGRDAGFLLRQVAKVPSVTVAAEGPSDRMGKEPRSHHSGPRRVEQHGWPQAKWQRDGVGIALRRQLGDGVLLSLTGPTWVGRCQGPGSYGAGPPGSSVATSLRR